MDASRKLRPEEETTTAAVRAPLEALARIAIALNSTLELDEVLDVLVRELLDTTGARRVSVLLCPEDDGAAYDPLTGRAARGPRQLVPAVALAREEDVALWQMFRDADPIELDADQRAAFARARVVVIEQPDIDELIPDGWADTFGLECVALVPLFAEGEPCGLLAVDYPGETGVPAPEREFLQTVADYAGVGVAHARHYEQIRWSGRVGDLLRETAMKLVGPQHEDTVAEELAVAMQDLLDAEVVGIGRLEGEERLHPLFVTDGHPVPSSCRLDEVPSHIVEQVEEVWGRGIARACQLEADPWLRGLLPDVEVGRFAVFPLLADARPVAAMLAARRRTAPWDEATIQAAETLALMGGGAMDRTVERRARRTRSRESRRSRSALAKQAADRFGLTEREREVLALLAACMSNEQIAERFYISVNTVKTHMNNLLRKLEVRGRREAVQKAYEAGLVPPPASYLPPGSDGP